MVAQPPGGPPPLSLEVSMLPYVFSLCAALVAWFVVLGAYAADEL